MENPKKKLIKINNPTDREFESLEFIKKNTGMATTSKAVVEAINVYPDHVNTIAELKKKVTELERWKMNTSIAVGNYIKSFNDLNDIIKPKK